MKKKNEKLEIQITKICSNEFFEGTKLSYGQQDNLIYMLNNI